MLIPVGSLLEVELHPSGVPVRCARAGVAMGRIPGVIRGLVLVRGEFYGDFIVSKLQVDVTRVDGEQRHWILNRRLIERK